MFGDQLGSSGFNHITFEHVGGLAYNLYAEDFEKKKKTSF